MGTIDKLKLYKFPVKPVHLHTFEPRLWYTDFNSDMDNVFTHESMDSYWLEGGKLIVDNPSGYVSSAVLSFPSPLRITRLDVDVKELVVYKSWRNPDIRLRSPDANNCYLMIKDTFHKVVGGTDTTLITFPYRILNGWITIILTDSTIYVLHNGNPIGSATDTTFRSFNSVSLGVNDGRYAYDRFALG